MRDIPQGTKSITTNAIYNIAQYAYVDVNVPTGITPSGTININANGVHDVSNYANADVNVPTGITPSGTKSITANGTYDVTNYANADVNVPAGITPTGTMNITANGDYDVTTYANAHVDVPAGITPSGTISIIRNGTFDVTNYEFAQIHLAIADEFSMSSDNWVYPESNTNTFALTCDSFLGELSSAFHFMVIAHDGSWTKEYPYETFLVGWVSPDDLTGICLYSDSSGNIHTSTMTVTKTSEDSEHIYYNVSVSSNLFKANKMYDAYCYKGIL